MRMSGSEGRPSTLSRPCFRRAGFARTALSLALLVLLAPVAAHAECADPFANPNEVLSFDLRMSRARWDALRFSERPGMRCDDQYPWFLVDFRCSDEEPWISIGVRRKRGEPHAGFVYPAGFIIERRIQQRRDKTDTDPLDVMGSRNAGRDDGGGCRFQGHDAGGLSPFPHHLGHPRPASGIPSGVIAGGSAHILTQRQFERVRGLLENQIFPRPAPLELDDLTETFCSSIVFGVPWPTFACPLIVKVLWNAPPLS